SNNNKLASAAISGLNIFSNNNLPNNNSQATSPFSAFNGTTTPALASCLSSLIAADNSHSNSKSSILADAGLPAGLQAGLPATAPTHAINLNSIISGQFASSFPLFNSS